MAEAQDEARAILAYQRICAMDSTRAAQQELLDSGVARHTVEALYPGTFETIAQPLAAYLLRHGAKLGEVSTNSLRDQRRETENSMWGVNEDLFDEWLRDSPVTTENWNTPAWLPLEDATIELHPNPQAGQAVVSILWGAWWLMNHRERLNLKNQDRAIACMCWVIDNIAPELVEGV